MYNTSHGPCVSEVKIRSVKRRKKKGDRKKERQSPGSPATAAAVMLYARLS